MISIPLMINSLSFPNRQSPFKPNMGPFASNHLPNSNESQNGHPFLHPQLQQQLLNSKSPNTSTVQLNQSQLAKNFNSSQAMPQQFSGQLHSTYPYHQLDKEKLNSLDKSQLPVNLYMNSPINLNNKRPKLNTETKSINQLMIDTMMYYESRKDGYNPQVEAISPTNLDDKNGEHRNTKEEILHSLEKLDRLIKKNESETSKKKRKQRELEALTNPSSQHQAENLEPNDLKQLSITQQIYTENKKKADESQKQLDKIRPLTIAVSKICC